MGASHCINFIWSTHSTLSTYLSVVINWFTLGRYEYRLTRFFFVFLGLGGFTLIKKTLKVWLSGEQHKTIIIFRYTGIPNPTIGIANQIECDCGFGFGWGFVICYLNVGNDMNYRSTAHSGPWHDISHIPKILNVRNSMGQEFCNICKAWNA